ncbi:MAG: anti-sigma factor antagonist [Eubacterium sp.]|nr:anti-sigma factor antagonist [Eubacterium sp.]MBP3205635.1 anti-sigma factor antagonist [Lachnospiraceae bacterium]MBQ8118324.1 anti-sigma factor antagonist [Lachnospiraceae bacterium]
MSMEEFQVIDKYLMIKLPEEVDHHRATDICKKADYYILKENVSNVVFDFEDTRFMDSSGIGIIMGRYRKISCFGGKVYAIHMDKKMERMFDMAGLKKIVEVLE